MRNISINNVVDTIEIQPKKTRRYLTWLLFSLIPRSQVKIQPVIHDLSSYDLIILGSPKWALSSPPINKYLNSLKRCKGRMCAVFITFGGFDEKRYLLQLENSLKKKKLRIIDRIAVRSSAIEKCEYLDEIKSFCMNIERIMKQKRLNQVL
jgi:hypothetical protein|tara:strand:- start:2359 stop:2811 length:453 start_codon:yes stop_codon:yes gene_type:complete